MFMVKTRGSVSVRDQITHIGIRNTPLQIARLLRCTSIEGEACPRIE